MKNQNFHSRILLWKGWLWLAGILILVPVTISLGCKLLGREKTVEDYNVALVQRVLTYEEVEDSEGGIFWANSSYASMPLMYYDQVALVNPEIEHKTTLSGAPVFKFWNPPPGKDSLKVAIPYPPLTVFPYARDPGSQFLVSQLYEPLFYVVDGELVNGGAEGYEVSEDETSATFYLRTDAYWSDGKQVVAQDYVNGILWAREYGSPYRSIDPKKISATAIDDFTLQLRIDGYETTYLDPNEGVLYFWLTAESFPLHPDVVANEESKGSKDLHSDSDTYLYL